MKAKFLAAGIAACFAAPAMAQSNVTIYGIADAGIMHVRNGGGDAKTKLVSGIADGSRLGFRGTEDMGGGWKAIFNLEARVELDTGRQQTGNLSSNQTVALTEGLNLTIPGLPAAVSTAVAGIVQNAVNPAINVNPSNALFDRTSMVGLITPVGAVLLGRMYTPGYEVLAAGDVFESGTAAGWGGIVGGTGGLLTAGVAIRSDKSIQYRIELPNGIKAAAMYGTEKSGYIGLDKRSWGANVRYVANGFDLGLGHNHGTDQVGNRGLITTTLAGAYSVNQWKLFAGAHKQKNENSVIIRLVGDTLAAQLPAGLPAAVAPLIPTMLGRINTNLKRNFYLDAISYQVGLHYKVGAGRVMASVVRQDDKRADASDATQFGLGYDHNLSKRTDVYLIGAYIKNENDGQYAIGAASASGGFTAKPGMSSKGVQIGMRHRF
ncbi:porin [Pseudoduganella namucuonensis]|uniref:Outer membrane protein (Porin) n=1 Tax=Pseudoduganella namucuonensis TaxID=1035707 RepID=A0A1I7LKL3_9BURK|nr:porin [Pseudoduganella namucuonensis]SFV10185.1 Outer membrane protein (porin) [Pseudoduganella namucuonensis]